LLAQIEEAHVAADGATLLVACSGGPDSIALASLLARLAPDRGWRLGLAHVNHHLRESSWQDECVVISVGARLHVPVRIAALDPPSTAEEPLREARYGALASIARAEGAAAVVTAHTAEDQTETVLLALFRGAGLEGLAGMPQRRRLAEGVELVRPLLRTPRADLHAELGASALPYVRDPGNADPAHRRNAVRDALGALREGFPRLDEAVARCAAIVADEIAGAPQAERRRRLRDALAAEVGLRDVPFERVEAALRARRGRVHIKPGVEFVVGEQVANTRVSRRES
jgi:tRNA(Ile)-lysidine synthase